MSSIDYHGALDELGVACEKAEGDWAFVENPLQGLKVRSLPSDHFLNKVLWKTGVFLQHLFLLARIICLLRHRMILVREFSNGPMLVIAPFLLPLRKKLFLTINHNVQWAMHSRIERFALRMLDRLGFRFLFLETPVGAGRIGLDCSRHRAILHPVSINSPIRPDKSPFTVGIVGHYRPEKGVDEALDVLLAEPFDYRLIVGIPNIADFNRPENERFELRDTSRSEDYYSTLAECDVLLLCYSEEGYQFRASGIIADAVACGAAVLVPRFPVLEHQVSAPVSIGECYSSLAEIPACLERMRNADYADALALYAKGRGADALAVCLNDLMMDG